MQWYKCIFSFSSCPSYIRPWESSLKVRYLYIPSLCKTIRCLTINLKQPCAVFVYNNMFLCTTGNISLTAVVLFIFAMQWDFPQRIRSYNLNVFVLKVFSFCVLSIRSSLLEAQNLIAFGKVMYWQIASNYKKYFVTQWFTQHFAIQIAHYSSCSWSLWNSLFEQS